MEQYINLVKEVLAKGTKKADRTNTGTISYFGMQQRYPVSKNAFPLLTIKKTYWKGIVHELLWFIKGDTNIKYLVDNSVNIWNDWPYQLFKKSTDYRGETLDEFIEKIKKEENFAKKHGNLGPIYGKQWRDFFGVDQLKNAIDLIKHNPNSRRIIISAWNPAQIDEMVLPPCHSFFQFYVCDNKLSLQLYQRSADIFLGVPFNIASYALLLLIVAEITGLELGEFVHTLGDSHIYLNHMNQVEKMLRNKPLPLPKIKFTRKLTSIDNIKYEDIELIEYQSHGAIKAKVAV